MTDDTQAAAQRSHFDTSRQRLADIYAKALLGAVGAAGASAESLLEELDSLVDDVLARLPDLESVLASPKVPHADKERMLDRAFGGKMSPVLLNFLKVASRRRRLELLRTVRQSAHRLHNEALGRLEVRVTSAAPLSPPQLETVRKRLIEQLGADIVLAADTNPELIGGLVVRVGDTVYDGSVADRLEKLRRTALVRTRQTIRGQVERFVQ